MNRLYCISTADNCQVTNVRVWTWLCSSRSDEGSAQVNSQALASHLLGSSTIFGNRYLFVQHRSSQTLPSIWNTYHYSHFTDEEKKLKGVIWFRSWPLDSKNKTLPPMLYFLPGWAGEAEWKLVGSERRGWHNRGYTHVCVWELTLEEVI